MMSPLRFSAFQHSLSSIPPIYFIVVFKNNRRRATREIKIAIGVAVVNRHLANIQIDEK